MKIGDEVSWTHPETGENNMGIIVAIDRWCHQPNLEIRDYKIEKKNGQLACISSPEVESVKLRVTKSRVQSTPR